MAYKIKNKEGKSFEIKGKPKKKYPVWYLEDPEGNGLTEKETLDLWQENVDNGNVWTLQGWYGRNAQAMLDAGILKHPKEKK